MRGGTVQITWHDAKPVLTLDFHSPTGLLATGGADFDIKLWLIAHGEALMKVPTACYHSNLSYHGSAVNILRFSPSGDLLASGADGGELILWKMHSVDDAHTWKVLKTLLFHRKDVLDLQWSSDGAFLISGSVDNSCIIWDINKGSVHQILDAHLHYVQGVAWDPLGQYVASLSSDRTCRIYMNKPAKVKGLEKLNYVCQHVVTKAEQQNQDDSKPSLTKHHLFHDETLPSFFRRFSWSPDGSFLLAPAGIYKVSADSTIINTAYIFSRKDLSRPALQLPGASKPIVAVRFCPVVFSLRGSDSAAFFKLPYRIIFAVATLNSLYIYDTESVPPIAILAGVHYSAITDIAWSSDAKFLALSSQDGYCTILEFENGELGTPSSLSDGRKIPENTDSMPQELDSTKSVAVESTEIDNLLKSKTDTKIIEEKPTLLSSEDTKEAIKPVRNRITPIAIENTKSVAVENMEINNLPKSKTDKKIIEEKPTSLLSSADTNEATKPARKRITPIAVEKP